MNPLIEGKHAGEFLISKANGDRSMETVTLASGTVEAGTIVGEVTATAGDFIAVNLLASDGTENAAGIAWEAVDATGGRQPMVIVRRDSTVRRSDLTYPDGADAAQQAALDAQLVALGIIVR